MKLIFRYMKECWKRIITSVTCKSLGSLGELMIPYILEHIIDDVVPTKNVIMVFAWGLCMIGAAYFVRTINIKGNHVAISVGRDCIKKLRHDLYKKTIHLSGSQFDAFSLPSLTSRMTSDSYNVQNFMVVVQAMGIRAPVMLFGGILVAMTMDPALASILCIMVPILGTIIFVVTRHGIPLYDKVQRSMDQVVRVMRENITGIRVVKALSKEDYEKKRFEDANRTMTANDIRASITMASPGPIMQLFLNIGLTLVVVIGAYRVNAGDIKPGVILAFLTYFNMIMMGIMGLNRIFMMASKATASADRIDLVLQAPEDQPVLPFDECDRLSTDAHITFDHVSFNYHRHLEEYAGKFDGEEAENCLDDIHFSINHGDSLGIIGATGSGKTTIISLLMRFYDCTEGGVYIDGRDVRSYMKEELHKKFGVVLQNDTIFNDTLRENISFGRDVTEEDLWHAAEVANLSDFIKTLDEQFDYMADIKGANLSGGQKQRTLISRALATKPEILILDDSSSALDYKTDAALRKAIDRDYGDTTMIMIAQRVSSVMNLTNIIVLDNGKIIGYGNHEHLMATCPTYSDIYHSQMGEID